MRAHGWTRNLSPGARAAAAEAHPDLDPRFTFIDVGFNMRPTDIQAAIGRVQLRALRASNAQRKANAEAISASIAHLAPALRTIRVDGHSDVALLAFPLLLQASDGEAGTNAYAALVRALEAAGVETRPVISGNFTRQPVLSLWAHEDGAGPTRALPVADAVHFHGLYIGLHGVPMDCSALGASIAAALTAATNAS
jgi:CDP-6-deoxy-D-xylo-4-hexulose-3-dehydrase